MKKERFSIQASTLGNYFGVGYLTPMEQLDIDLGLKEKIFDSKAEERMALGKLLEKSVLDFFEEKYNISIVNRNQEKMTLADGCLRGLIDGDTLFDGKDTVVECKVSNSKVMQFVDNPSYILQCYAYLIKGYQQALLLGLQNGVPSIKRIVYDKEICDDIEEMCKAVGSILMGIATIEDYPWHLVAKYKEKFGLIELDGVVIDGDEDDEYFKNKYIELNEQKKEIEQQIEAVKAEIMTKYEGKCDTIKTSDKLISIKKVKRKGAFSTELLKLDHPLLDLEPYYKEPTESIRFSLAKIKNPQ